MKLTKTAQERLNEIRLMTSQAESDVIRGIAEAYAEHCDRTTVTVYQVNRANRHYRTKMKGA